MASLVCRILLFICLCMHACYASARPLGLFGKDTRWSVHLHIKDLEEHDSQGLLHQEASVPSRLRSFVSGEQARKDQSNEEMFVKSSYAFPTEESSKIAASGTGISISLTKAGLNEAIKIKDVRRQGRSMLGDTHEDPKESVAACDNDKKMDDISEMDYAQPHQKSPIHNEKRP